MNNSNCIRVAIAGLGNCASSLIEGIHYYRQNPGLEAGLLFPILSGYSVRDIDVVAAFDISSLKVGKLVKEAIYQSPNNFVRIPGVQVDGSARVFRGPTLDGNPEHLARFVSESKEPPVNVASILEDNHVEVFINMLPTGSLEATEFYARAALEAGCAFINCIPTVLAQRDDVQELYRQGQLPLLGDDIKSQIGTTILHRALLHLLESRGATLNKTSQVNIGGNTDFANFVYRAESKLVSKRKSLARYLNGQTDFHVGHHYDPTKGPLKNAFIEIEAAVFGGSPVKISVKLESDDKPNSAGSVVDLIRIARGALDQRIGGYIPDACAFYFKSPPSPMDDLEALEMIRENWVASYVEAAEKV
ncbi:MAG TPA: inositol-3-phosphate synthase [Anaerolineales bacterium]|nr:inositol-3-phosphate synthase [Anaerolineales bacterium]